MVSPVVATANTAVAAIDRLKERGAKDIRLVCLSAAPEGVERLRGLHPDVPVWTAGLDQGLDAHAYILPGLGDAGDRAYGTRWVSSWSALQRIFVRARSHKSDSVKRSWLNVYFAAKASELPRCRDTAANSLSISKHRFAGHYVIAKFSKASDDDRRHVCRRPASRGATLWDPAPQTATQAAQ